ncbi:MAG: alpha/beta hydrolase, partial [Bosea sp. (in: a-proteobacteria)]
MSTSIQPANPRRQAELAMILDAKIPATATAPSRRLLLATALTAPIAACSPLGAFNIVAGGEGGARQVVSGAAFGSHPRQRLDVYAPIAARGPLPVIFFIYGGSWNSGRRDDYGFVGQALASRGYVVVIADYRLVPEVLFPTFLDDGALALRWVQDNIAASGGDPRRIGLAGHSAGAYNALMLALDQRYLRRAGFETARIRAVAGLAGPYDFFPFDSPLAIAAMGTWPEPRQTQPINFVRGGMPPVFLATGDADT